MKNQDVLEIFESLPESSNKNVKFVEKCKKVAEKIHNNHKDLVLSDVYSTSKKVKRILEARPHCERNSNLWLKWRQ